MGRNGMFWEVALPHLGPSSRRARPRVANEARRLDVKEPTPRGDATRARCVPPYIPVALRARVLWRAALFDQTRLAERKRRKNFRRTDFVLAARCACAVCT